MMKLDDNLFDIQIDQSHRFFSAVHFDPKSPYDSWDPTVSIHKLCTFTKREFMQRSLHVGLGSPNSLYTVLLLESITGTLVQQGGF